MAEATTRLRREASAIRAVSPVIDEDAHDEARLAFLIELALADEELADHHTALRKLSVSKASLHDDVVGLADSVVAIANAIGFQPLLLAICLIPWREEKDLAPNKTEGSADWFDFPRLLESRNELAMEISNLSRDLHLILQGISEEPETEVELAAKKAGDLHKRLRDILSGIRGAKGRRKQLFYHQSKLQLSAFYLRRIRRVPIDDSRFLELFKMSGEDFDTSNRTQRSALSRRADDCAAQVQRLVDDLLADYGVERQKRQYRRSAEP
ncbi:MAG: hypothetical protein ABL962_04210 [Fimbriimonadaceae bacterium]